MTTSAANHRPWVEKYRPKDLQTVAHQTEVVATLQNAVRTGNLPHLLFYGPPGSGKTSVALALCRQLWHPSQWKRRVLELNASDERGISVVRDKIKHFAALAVGHETSKPSTKSFFGSATNDADEEEKQHAYPNPPFKIIILDEADTVTPDAQAALRRIIEANSRVTRFILICNYVTRIIAPLASRCAKFRFQALPAASMKARLEEICQHEQCSDAELVWLDDILRYADGDMRRAVTTMQSVHTLFVGAGATMPFSTDLIAEIAGVPPPQLVQQLWEACLQSSSFDAMHRAVQDVMAAGCSAPGILSSFVDRLLTAEDEVAFEELQRAQLAIRIAEAEKNMIDGADEELQLVTVCSLLFSCAQAQRSAMRQ